MFRSLAASAAAIALLVGGATVASAAPPTTEQLVERALSRAPAATASVEAVEATVSGASATVAGPDGTSISVTGAGESLGRTTPDKAGQVLTVVRDGGATTTVRYVVQTSGVTLEEDGEGGYLLAHSAGGMSAAIGVVDAPWAIDAAGRSLPTSYRLQGTTLVQEIDTSEATFPVVADPSFSLGWDWSAGTIAYWKYNRTETRAIATESNSGPQALSTFMCGAVPSWAGKGICTTLVAYRFDQVRNTAKAAASQSRCLWIVTPTTNFVAHIYYFKTYNHSC